MVKGNKFASLAPKVGSVSEIHISHNKRVTVVVVGLVLVVVPGKICSYALTKYARLLLKQRHNDRLH